MRTVVQNTRPQAVHLDADQCGGVTEVVRARTVVDPEGQTYPGSLGQVKELVLSPQRLSQVPARFQLRPVSGGPGMPDCVRPTTPVTVEAGDTVEVPTTTVMEPEMIVGDPALSSGQLIDRMLEHRPLRDFIAAQPADSWLRGQLFPSGNEYAFRAMSMGYERAISATVSADGRTVSDLRLPGDGDRTRTFERRTGTLPPGVAVVPDNENWVLGDDVVAGRLVLPSGRVAAAAYFPGGIELGQYRTKPGSYPVHVTLAHYPGSDDNRPTLASVVVSSAPTVQWKGVASIAADGGVAGFTSVEGNDALAQLSDVDEAASSSLQDAAFDSLYAHDERITEFPIDDKLNLAIFSTGLGDGTYNVYVGFDGAGKPTHFVIDFMLITLDWPSP